MNARQTDELDTATAAALWLESLKSACPHERREFSAWLRESPLHVRHFLLATALEKELDASALLPGRNHSTEPAAASNVVQLDIRQWTAPAYRAPRPYAASRRTGYAAAIAACFVASVGLGVGAMWWTAARPTLYTTEVGEQRRVSLADGSSIDVNAVSRMDVAYSRSARDVRLVSGEALFQVAHDARRPFQVQVGGAVVRAVGTVFNVDRRGDHTAVAVLEGRVLVFSAAGTAQVSAGELTDISADGRINRVRKGDVEAAAAWREGRLVFARATLAEIADELNRYNPGLKLVVEGARLRGMTVSANLYAKDPEVLLQALSAYPTITVERSDGAAVIRERAAP